MNPNITGSRRIALDIVEKESEAQFKRLVKQRKKGDIFYEPDKNSLYVWELEINREDVGMGYRNWHRWTNLYITRDHAVRGACEEIIRYWSWSEEYIKEFKAKVAKLGHEAAMDDFVQHHMALRFKIGQVEVRATSELREISNPPTSEET